MMIKKIIFKLIIIKKKKMKKKRKMSKMYKFIKINY